MGPRQSLAPKPSATCASSMPVCDQSTPIRAFSDPVIRASATARSVSSSDAAGAIHVISSAAVS